MGLFGINYNRPGPGVEKDAPPKKGLLRFFELLGRDYAPLWRVGLVTMVSFIPMLLCVLILYEFRGYIIPMAVGLVGFFLSAVLAGRAVAAQTAVTLKAVRDIPGFVWHDYKKAWKDNKKQAGKAGVVMFSLIGIEFSSILFMLFGENQFSLVVFAMAVLGLIVCVGCGLLCFSQMVFLEMDLFTMVKNSFFLMFGFLNRTLPGVLCILLPYALIALFLNVALQVLLWPVLFLAGFHVVLLLAYGQWIWPVMESAFHITERQRARDAEREAQAAAAAASDDAEA